MEALGLCETITTARCGCTASTGTDDGEWPFMNVSAALMALWSQQDDPDGVDFSSRMFLVQNCLHHPRHPTSFRVKPLRRVEDRGVLLLIFT
jgi:hypothetical protein